MPDSLLISRALHRLLGGLVVIPYRPGKVMSAFEMHGQSGRNLTTLLAIACLFACANPPMELGLAGCRDAFVDDVLIEGMPKPITRGHCAIGPDIHPARLKKFPPPRQLLTPGLRLDH